MEQINTITSARYANDDNTEIIVIINGLQHIVPINNENRHYQAILEWVADGNMIQEAE